jgi:CRP/FNR family cyclic AMP-dependent transcriptional regulator
VAMSHLRHVPGEVLDCLLLGARTTSAGRGTTVHRVGESRRHVELVVHGLVRVHATASDGRTLTVRYCRSGALMGIMSLYVEPFIMPATTQAMMDTELLTLRPDVVRRHADTDLRVANALLLELGERAATFAAEIGGTVFSTVRQRVARHLLDLAAQFPHDDQLVARISQQELADAVGTVREVVVRTLRELRRDGLIDTGRSGIGIIDPEQLLTEAYPAPPSSSLWNTGP